MPNNKSSKNGNNRNAKCHNNVPNARPAQNTARTRKKAARSTGKTKAVTRSVIQHGLNAFHPLHIPLPISTGKYNVIRVCADFTSDNYLTLIGAMDYASAGSHTYHDSVWTNYGGIAKAQGTDLMTGQWSALALPSPTGNDSRGFASVVPSAVSVQVLNPASLNTAAGVVYMGRCSTILSGVEGSDTRNVADFCNALLSYSSSKRISGARLAMSPQQINCVPADLNDLTAFRELGPPSDQASPQTSFAWDTNYDFAGFKPAYIINPQKQTLSYRVCIEYRVRLSPFNPMHNTQQLHKPVSHDMWHKIVGTAESVGHGVEDAGVVGAAGYMMSGAGEGIMAAAGSYISSAASAMLPTLAEAAPLLAL